MLLNIMLLRSNLVKVGFSSFTTGFGMANSMNWHASKFKSFKEWNFKAALVIKIPNNLQEVVNAIDNYYQ